MHPMLQSSSQWISSCTWYLVGKDSIDVALKLLKTPPTLVLNTVLLDYFAFQSCSLRVAVNLVNFAERVPYKSGD